LARLCGWSWRIARVVNCIGVPFGVAMSAVER
jgi:hypothetical protein